MRLVKDKLLGSAVCVNAGLSASELSGSIVLPNARLVLSEVLECGGARLTAAGFFKRAFVMQIGARLDWPNFDWQAICAVSKNPREADTSPLWFLHGVLKLAGLFYARHGTLHVGKQGRELIKPEPAGDLQATLFRATWCELDLANLAGIALGEHLQGQGRPSRR